MNLHSPFLCSRKNPELGYSLNQKYIPPFHIALAAIAAMSFSVNDKIALTPYMVTPKNICSFNCYHNSGKAVLVARASRRGGGAPIYHKYLHIVVCLCQNMRQAHLDALSVRKSFYQKMKLIGISQRFILMKKPM